MGRRFGAFVLRVHGLLPTVDDVVVDAVLDVRAAVGHAEDALGVGLVLREQQRRVAFAVEVSLSERGMDRLNDARRSGADLLQGRPIGGAEPGPFVAEPQRRQDVDLRGLRAAVVDGDLDQQVLGPLLGVLDDDVEVAILVEHAGVEQLVLELRAAPAAAGVNQVRVGKGRLRVLVEVLHVRVGRRAVEVEIVLLDVLAVVAFAVGQAEQALLQDGVVSVPQGQREAEPLVVVRDAGQAVLAPPVGARARLVVAEVVPGIAAFAVVFANGAPLALAQVRPPFFPGDVFHVGLIKPDVFGGHWTHTSQKGNPSICL